jgi:serine protease Do
VTIGKVTTETIASAKATRKAESQLTSLGLAIQTLTTDLARQFGVEDTEGVLITGIEDGSLAAMSELQVGDLILEADRQPVSNVEELQSILNKDKEQILLLIKRKNGSIYLVFRLK